MPTELKARSCGDRLRYTLRWTLLTTACLNLTMFLENGLAADDQLPDWWSRHREAFMLVNGALFIPRRIA